MQGSNGESGGVATKGRSEIYSVEPLAFSVWRLAFSCLAKLALST